MKIKINGETVSIFAGATVADAVRMALRSSGKTAKNTNLPPARDRYGHDVAPDGELSEGDELVVEIEARERRKS